jgi:GTP-binding protein LepA
MDGSTGSTQARIRNFAIIAHIDHGKSTLADRLLEMTGTVAHRDMQAQLLDSNPIERERGITIKLAPVRMKYKRFRIQDSGIRNEKESDQKYILNLIDTPGHVDFSYEVSRSLAACEGAVLVVDATQGVQAQTLAHLHQARHNKLTIVPVVNKIDMPGANIEQTTAELMELGFNREAIIPISAKTGENVGKLLIAIIERIPPPNGAREAQTRALVFSSQYDPHKGVVCFVRVVDGAIGTGPKTRLQFLTSGAEVTPIEVGFFSPKMTASEGLVTGEVGYIATGLKDVRMAKVGDTITTSSSFIVHSSSPKQTKTNHEPRTMNHEPITPLSGYKEPKSMVFLSLFPVAADEFTASREAMEKLRLSDSAFTFRPISSAALGNGFHCGFLGLLHAEVVQERILREFDLTMMATAPSVEYQIKVKSHKSKVITDSEGFYSIQSASEYPDPTVIEQVREPVMEVKIFTPKRYVGAVMQLATEKRGEYIDLIYHGENAEFTYLLPLSDMIIDFFDRLKSVSEGYASLDYEFFDFAPVDVSKVDILLNHEKVDALSFLVVRDQAVFRAREICERLAKVIPRHQFNIPVQGAIGGQIIARADIKPFRKDVIQKLYGGDRTRKDKLLEKQKKGKARMKRIGSVEVPQAAFFEVLKRE